MMRAPAASFFASLVETTCTTAYRGAVTLAAAAALAACGSEEAPPPSTPVYYGQVQKLIQDNCTECHSADADRLAPFPLVTYEDAVTASKTWPMAFAVMNRVMPPYYATNDGSCQTLTTKWLSDDDMATLVGWINSADHPAGDVADSAPPPGAPPALPSVDATVDIGGAYTPDRTQIDDYRCFVVDPVSGGVGGGAERFVTGAHVRPTNFTVAHHVILFTLDTAAAEADVIAKDAADPGLGFACGAGGPTAEGSSFLVGWAPGNQAQLFPSGTGIPVSTSRKMVVQVHYNLDNSDGGSDHTTIDLDLADSVAYRGSMVPVTGDVNLPARTPDAIAAGSRRLPTNLGALRAWGTMIHMHQRGIAAELTIEGSAPACLADLDQWSFHWQHYYPYAQPVPLRGGDTVRLTCHFDTSNDSVPVRWGEGSDDEMCIAYLYISE
jgi:hypothetical protein